MGDTTYLSQDEAAAKEAAAKIVADKEQAERLAQETITTAQLSSAAEVGARRAIDRAESGQPRDEFENRIRNAQGAEAPLSEVSLLNVDELKAIGAKMREQGKPYLSNEEIDAMAAVLRQAHDAKGLPVRSSDGTTVIDGSGQPVRAAETESIASLAVAGAVSRLVIGENTELKHQADEIHAKAHTLSGEIDERRITGSPRTLSLEEIAHMPNTSSIDDSAREALKKQAIDATLNLSDKGDMLAAARLLDKIEHNASSQEIAQAMLELDKAKHAEDITIRLRNGKTISIVNDGDGSPEVTVTEGSGGKSKSYDIPEESLYMSSGEGRRPRGMANALAAAIALEMGNNIFSDSPAPAAQRQDNSTLAGDSRGEKRDNAMLDVAIANELFASMKGLSNSELQSPVGTPAQSQPAPQLGVA